MTTLVRISEENVEAFKDVRLRALQEAPFAFGSTYARELGFTGEEWARRVARWDGVCGVGFLAMDGDSVCGLAGGLLDEARVELVSMWTDPVWRGCGVGRMLVEEVVRWAAGRGAKGVRLMVTSNNGGAVRFYERLGFARTGKTLPYPNDAALEEWEMYRPGGEMRLEAAEDVRDR